MMGPKGRGFAQKVRLVLWDGRRLSGRTFRRMKRLWHKRLRAEPVPSAGPRP